MLVGQGTLVETWNSPARADGQQLQPWQLLCPTSLHLTPGTGIPDKWSWEPRGSHLSGSQWEVKGSRILVPKTGTLRSHLLPVISLLAMEFQTLELHEEYCILSPCFQDNFLSLWNSAKFLIKVEFYTQCYLNMVWAGIRCKLPLIKDLLYASKYCSAAYISQSYKVYLQYQGNIAN